MYNVSSGRQVSCQNAERRPHAFHRAPRRPMIDSSKHAPAAKSGEEARLARTLAVVGAAVAAVLIGSTFGTGAAQGQGVPAFSHVFVVIMENREAEAILGGPD